jgi:hypothetical protein
VDADPRRAPARLDGAGAARPAAARAAEGDAEGGEKRSSGHALAPVPPGGGSIQR